MISNPSFPDIYMNGMNDNNPYIYSPNVPYAIFMYQTRDTLFGDANIFVKFISNCISRFRKRRFYTSYKAYLYDIGMDHCQVLSNIDNTMADLEMHHNGITIFDITIMITYHILAIKGKVSTFDVVKELVKCHKYNEVPLVMVCKSIHQMVHNDAEFFLPAQMCFGNWDKLVKTYYRGITFGIARKLSYWIKKSIEQSDNQDYNISLLGLRKSIENWSEYNEYHDGCYSNRNTNHDNIIDRIYKSTDSSIGW